MLQFKSQINLKHILLFAFADKKWSDDNDFDNKLQVYLYGFILNNTLKRLSFTMLVCRKSSDGTFESSIYKWKDLFTEC